jgi:GNAT superfamily N-acetyltransferase
MDYRLASDDDLPLLGRMNAQLIEDEGHQNPMSVAALEERMAKWLSSAYRAVLVEVAGQVVAYALYRPADDGWEGESKGIYLRQFFVPRTQRRKGHGTAAFELLRERLWGPRCRITLETLIDNQAAHAFWRALGFREYCISYELPAQRGE